MVNETSQGFHASKREKCRLHARSFGVTYCEGPVETGELMDRETDGSEMGRTREMPRKAAVVQGVTRHRLMLLTKKESRIEDEEVSGDPGEICLSNQGHKS